MNLRRHFVSKRLLAMILTLIMLISIISASGITASGLSAEKISHPDRRSGEIDGLDRNPMIGMHNSYAWSGTLFEQTEGDYLWVGMNRDLAGNIVNRFEVGFGSFLEGLVPTVSPDGAGRIYRQRASDPNAQWELVYADPRVNGFRNMVVFNGDLYVLAGLTNYTISEFAYVLRFSKGFRPGIDKPEVVLWHRIPRATGDMDLHLTGAALEYYRAIEVFDGKLYVGTFDSKIFATDGNGLQDLQPGSGNNLTGWTLIRDFAVPGVGASIVWDLCGFNGKLYSFHVTYAGYRIYEITPLPGGNGYEHKQIVGDAPAPIFYGHGNFSNMAANGFVVNVGGQEYMYVATYSDVPNMVGAFSDSQLLPLFGRNFNPASIFRMDTNGNWEVVVGDRTGPRAYRYANGALIPHVGNYRAGFSLIPDNQLNTSLNQYVWQIAEHEGKVYATTFDMRTIWQYGPWVMTYESSKLPGSSPIFNKYSTDYLRAHDLLTRNLHLIDLEAMAAAIDFYFEGLERAYGVLPGYPLPVSRPEEVRPLVVGLMAVVNGYLPSAEHRQIMSTSMVDMITELIIGIMNGEIESPGMTAREYAADMMREYSLTAVYFSDYSNPSGFDLYVSEDGKTFSPVTVNGFGDSYNWGGRVLVPSVHGLYTLTANPFFGGQVWNVDPMGLGIFPNGPQRIELGFSSELAMTALVTDHGVTGSSLRVSTDSDLVSAAVSRRPAIQVKNITWDNQVVYDAQLAQPVYNVTETVTTHSSVMYDVFLSPLKAGRGPVTLNFEIGGVTASRTIDVSVIWAIYPDTTALDKRILEASALRRTDYTMESWVPFIAAYSAALAVSNNYQVTQSQIDYALAALNTAINQLVLAAPPSGFTIIKTEAQLRGMTRKGNYWLANDIELTRAWTPMLRFSGTFYGNGHTISNVTINTSSNYQGLFRRLDGAVIESLVIQVAPAGIRGGYRVGALAGDAKKSTVFDVRVMLGHNGVVGKRYVGGLVGRAESSYFVACYTIGHSGFNEMYVFYPEPVATVAVKGTKVGEAAVGGLIGELGTNSYVANCATYVNVEGYQTVGGLIGRSRNAHIANTYSRGRVHGLTTQSSKGKYSKGQNIGGLIGLSTGSFGQVEDSYTSSAVVSLNAASRVNPFVGYVESKLATRGLSYYNTETLGTSVTQQLMKNITANDVLAQAQGLTIKPLTNLQMTDVLTYITMGANWDFQNIWAIGLYHGTPLMTYSFPYHLAGVALATQPPFVNTVVQTSSEISGMGIAQNTIINVELPGGSTLKTTTNKDLTWSAKLPKGTTLKEGDEITVTQQIPGLEASTEVVAQVRVDRPVDMEISAVDLDNITHEDSGVNLVGDVIRQSVTVNNIGNPNERADRIQLIEVLPAGMTYVPGSVRMIYENDNGDEVIVTVPQNTSSVSSRGHSYNATSRKLEIRLGDQRLSGGESVIVEYDVKIDTGARGSELALKTVSVEATRVSKSSKDNNVSAVVIVDEVITVEN